MVNLVKAIMSTNKSNEKQMKWLKKQLKANERDINKQRADMAPIHAAVFTDNTEIVKLIVKTNGVNVDATCKAEVNGKLVAHSVLDVAVKQPHPSIEIIKILLEYVRNPVSCDTLGVPACIVTAFGYEYFDILELFRGKACLLGTVDGSLFSKLATIVLIVDKPTVLRWLLQLPEVINFMDEGEEVKRFYIIDLLESSRKHDQVEMCELLTEFLGESPSGLKGGDDGMSLKDCFTEVMGESQGGLDGDEDGVSLKDCVPACENPPKDNSKGTNVAVKIKYCWNCKNPSRYMCAGCRKARYCESSCQWEDWASHKEYCLVKMNKLAFKEFESISPAIFQ